MKILLTSTSFQDTPGTHQDLLNAQNWDIDYLRGPVNERALLPIIHKYDGVICGDDEYTREVIKAGKEGRLRALSKYGVGLDRIDLSAAEEFEIKVTNVPGVNQVSVAEHVLALLFTFQKNVHLQYNSVQNSSWERLTGSEIQDSSIGIIGLGSVGKELAKKSLALGMKVFGFDLFKDEIFLKENKEVVFTENINVLYENCDVLSLHIPHNANTDKFIDKDVLFSRLKRKPIIINTSRGKLVDTDYLIRALEEGRVKGYLADVLAEEPISIGEKLVGKKNVIITPHVGSRTFQSVERQGTKAILNLLEATELK
ncbi:NAD(P)-binding domain-containing protein [Schleiferiaceae bacterium]|nr:NAD(P)-binding domain-containing protein [Schleiferiaceae bacterium]